MRYHASSEGGSGLVARRPAHSALAPVTLVLGGARSGKSAYAGRLWSRQPGTSAFDSAAGVATDRDDNIYVVGWSDGALGGPFKGGGSDAWVIKFSSNGHRLWSRQPGTSETDGATGVATDADGNVSVVGFTRGALGGATKGGADAWVIKYAR